MKIALLQYPFLPKAEQTLGKLFSLYEKVSGADLVVAPELGLTGFEEAFDFNVLNKAREVFISKIDKGAPPLLVGGASSQRKSVAFLFEGKEVFTVAEKINLFPGFDPEKGFLPGRFHLPFRFKDILFGALICYDLRFPEIAKFLTTRGARAIFVLAAWPEERIPHFHALLRARAIENQIFVVGANAMGVVAGVELGGRSVVFDPWGRELLLAEGEGIFEVELDFERLKKARSLFTTSRFTPPVPPEAKILPLETLLPLLEEARELGQKIVFTNGCFDLLHAGHVSYLEAARKEGDLLVVGLNTDRSVRKIKGPGRPLNPEGFRARVLAGLAAVDFVVLFHEETPERLIRAIKPDVLVKGADWPEDKIVGAPFVKSYGGRIVRIPFEFDVSTTKIVTKIRDEAPSH